MEENVNKTAHQENAECVEFTEQSQQSQTLQAEMEQPTMVELSLTAILKWILFLLGIVFIAYGGYLYTEDVNYYSSPMMFDEKRYVGGDAYNYIISASRSTAIMVKSLIWVVLGSTTVLVSRTIHSSKK